MKGKIFVATLMLMVERSWLVQGIVDPIPGNLCEVNSKVFSTEFTTSSDATIFQNQPKISAGKGQFLVGVTANGERRSLLKFAVEALPRDAKIVCAELRLYASVSNEDRGKVAVPRTRLHQITSDWTTSGKNALTSINGGFVQTGDTTWAYSKYPTRQWVTDGGDFNDKILSTETLEDDLHWFGATTEMTDLTQNWVDGLQPNYGFMMISDQTDVAYSFYHGFDNSPEFIPRFIVTYTSPLDGKSHLPLDPEKGNSSVITNTSKENNIGLPEALLITGIFFSTFLVLIALYLRPSKKGTQSMETTRNETAGSVV